ncbi:hypothetical protein CEXT_268501 [Caerostris extrusa]|uniref:Uncharacterized protein n=1 Tax=Caerostris extrusa TaxID=172846 RepID=A0AAV4VFM7_CAEEX|nr:hypothetical protein CEXT_268501 [Caerostris extrusa]
MVGKRENHDLSICPVEREGWGGVEGLPSLPPSLNNPSASLKMAIFSYVSEVSGFCPSPLANSLVPPLPPIKSPKLLMSWESFGLNSFSFFFSFSFPAEDVNGVFCFNLGHTEDCGRVYFPLLVYWLEVE